MQLNCVCQLPLVIESSLQHLKEKVHVKRRNAEGAELLPMRLVLHSSCHYLLGCRPAPQSHQVVQASSRVIALRAPSHGVLHRVISVAPIPTPRRLYFIYPTEEDRKTPVAREDLGGVKTCPSFVLYLLPIVRK